MANRCHDFFPKKMVLFRKAVMSKILTRHCASMLVNLRYSLEDEVKAEILRRALAVLYTPSDEHFGIVPLEAMYMRYTFYNSYVVA